MMEPSVRVLVRTMDLLVAGSTTMPNAPSPMAIVSSWPSSMIGSDPWKFRPSFTARSFSSSSMTRRSCTTSLTSGGARSSSSPAAGFTLSPVRTSFGLRSSCLLPVRVVLLVLCTTAAISRRSLFLVVLFLFLHLTSRGRAFPLRRSRGKRLGSLGRSAFAWGRSRGLRRLGRSSTPSQARTPECPDLPQAAGHNVGCDDTQPRRAPGRFQFH